MAATHVLVAALAFAAVASALPGLRERRIINGEAANIEDAPWKGQFEYLKKGLFSNSHDTDITCTAVLVSKRQALTAAHCLGKEDQEKNIKDIKNFARLRFGATEKFGKDGVQVGIVSVIVHPRHLGGELAFDVAVLNLDKDVPFSDKVRPIRIATEKPAVGEDLNVGGWGRTHREEFQFHKTLKTALMTVMDNAICDDVKQSWGGLSTPFICVSPKTGDTAAGDSGSAMWNFNNELVGVLRGGGVLDTPAYKGEASVYVDVNNPAVSCFLVQHLEKGLIDGPEVC